MSLLINDCTLIDGAAEQPLAQHSLLIEGNRIRAVGPRGKLEVPAGTQTIDARGKYVVPGLMDANIHLCMDMRPENLIRHEGRYEPLVLESAQVALKNGLTTVFDTLGPRQPLMTVRDQIAAGTAVGARIYCAGNIVGLDGPFSTDFFADAGMLSKDLLERINALWVENSGPALSWMTPEQVGREVETYVRRGIDFVKYASNEHRWGDRSTFLLFSPLAQKHIVDAAHGLGVTAQAHTGSVEGLRVAVEAGCDLIQHANITGPFPIPESTLETMVMRGTAAVVFPFTQQRFDWIMANCPIDRAYFETSDINCRNLMRAGVKLLLATDAILFAPEMRSDPRWMGYWLAPGKDNLADLGNGHFAWMRAMEQKGFAPLEILRAATRNIAAAYGKSADLGTLEAGKFADLLILDKDPLQSTENYRCIHTIVKDGHVVDRESLPTNPIQTRPLAEPTAAMLAYRNHRHIGNSRFPFCC